MTLLQLLLPLPQAQTSGARTITIAGRTYHVAIARHPRARRYLLRVAGETTLRLTVPRGASIADGLAFAARQRDWIEREQLRQRRRLSRWQDGSVVWFRGRKERLVVTASAVQCGSETIVRRAASSGDLREAVERHFRELAVGELPPRCFAFAAAAGLELARVSVRNQKSRWGACSSRGVITLNWRLVQMPPSVSDYILWHELMHLRQPNHSRRFWREVDGVCPTWRESERWLRTHGKEIL